MADYPEQGSVESPAYPRRYDGPTESDVKATMEPSLEDDLNLLDNQLGELANLMEQINSTKRRIEGKNSHLGQRIGKSYEAFALISRGEMGMSAPAVPREW